MKRTFHPSFTSSRKPSPTIPLTEVWPMCAHPVVLNRHVSKSCQNSGTREAGRTGEVRNLYQQALGGLVMGQAWSHALSMPFICPSQLHMKERILNLAKLHLHMREGDKLLAQNHKREHMAELECKPRPVGHVGSFLGQLAPQSKAARVGRPSTATGGQGHRQALSAWLRRWALS